MIWKLWLDDKIHDPDAVDRHVPDGFIGADSTVAALGLVDDLGPPSHMDLDHDHDHDLGEGDDALVFLRALVEICEDSPPTWSVHSGNPIGRDRINAFMESWTRHAPRRSP